MKLFGKLGNAVDGVIGKVVSKTNTVAKTVYDSSPHDVVKMSKSGINKAAVRLGALATKTKAVVMAKIKPVKTVADNNVKTAE